MDKDSKVYKLLKDIDEIDMNFSNRDLAFIEIILCTKEYNDLEKIIYDYYQDTMFDDIYYLLGKTIDFINARSLSIKIKKEERELKEDISRIRFNILNEKVQSLI